MPSELETQKARKESLLKQAIASHNEGVQEHKRDRRNARIEMQGLIREQRAAHAKWQKEQDRQADEGGWLAGASMGAGAGASIGSFFPGYGTAIGAGIGALAGGIYGGVVGRQEVQEVAPYVGAATQIAGGISSMRQSQERNKQLMDFYKGRDMRPGDIGASGWGTDPMTLGDPASQLKLNTDFTDLGNIQAQYATQRRGLLPESMTSGVNMIEQRKGRNFYDLMNPPAPFTPPPPPDPPPLPTGAVDKWGYRR